MHLSVGGLNVLQLMNEPTAVALNYGMFRRKEINGTVRWEPALSSSVFLSPFRLLYRRWNTFLYPPFKPVLCFRDILVRIRIADPYQRIRIVLFSSVAKVKVKKSKKVVPGKGQDFFLTFCLLMGYGSGSATQLQIIFRISVAKL